MKGIKIFIVACFFVVSCNYEPLSPSNTVKLSAAHVQALDEENPFVIVSEKPVDSGLPEYWMVLAKPKKYKDKIAILVLVRKRSGTIRLPLNFLQPGRALNLSEVCLKTPAASFKDFGNTYIGEPVY